jgi:membrane protease YdiL (CAAX protease family)
MTNPTADFAHPASTLLGRYLACAVFVLLWMAGEFYFRLSPLTSQLLGIPLIAAFQLVIARRPLQQLWAFDADTFRLDRKTLAVAGVLAVIGGVMLCCGSGRPAAGLHDRAKLFLLVLAAVVPAAFALREQRGSALRSACGTVIGAVIFRVGWHAAWAQHGPVVFPAAKVPEFLTVWFCEFVALFLVDEVAFRGALDPYLVRASRGRLHEWCSAIFVSILWAIWHLPAYNPGAKTFLGLFAQVGPFSISLVIMGTLLSFAARRSRTLVPTSAVHALGNAYVLALRS